MSKERPIIFQGPKVRTILDWDFDTKDDMQTRRVIKPQPQSIDETTKKTIPYNGTAAFLLKELRCPYGKPGDRLWVREKHYFDVQLTEDRWHVVYDNPTEMPHWSNYDNDKNPKLNKWRPSIHMPRWASRILLEVTDVRVELVQEISPEDAIAEGIQEKHTLIVGADLAVNLFHELWDSINDKRGFGWDTNPWVRVVGFRKVNG